MKHTVPFLMLALSITQLCAQPDFTVPPLNTAKKHKGFADKGSWEIGFFTSTVRGSQFSNFDISDCSIYGLKALDSNSKESRYRIPLGDLADRNFQLYGFQTAMRWNYAKKVQGGLVMRGAFGDGMNFAQIGLQVSPQLITFRGLRLTGEFEIGGTASSVRVKNVQPLAGYHQFYRADGFDLKPGDDVFIDNSDAFVSGGMGIQCAIKEHMQLYSTIMFNRNFAMGKFSMYNSQDDDNYLESGSEAIVTANELSAARSNIQPNLLRVGPMVSIGLRIDIGGYPETETKTKTCECCGQVIAE